MAPGQGRERLGLTQGEFAKTYWISLGTLRELIGERGESRKNADLTAQDCLQVIEKDLAVVASLLRSSVRSKNKYHCALQAAWARFGVSLTV